MPRSTPGNYVPLDVNYPRDGAIRRAGEAAELLYVRSLAYAKGAKTDGFVPEYDLEVVGIGLRNLTKRVGLLVREGLWIETNSGWFIRSWFSWNGTAQAEAAFLENQSDKGKEGNHKRWHIGGGITSPDCVYCRNPNRLPDPKPDSQPDPVPESPIREGKGREGKGSREAAQAPPTPRGSRLQDGWIPDPAVREQMAVECPNIDLAFEHRKFMDFWTNKTGKDATKIDWNKAWRNWIRGARPTNGHTNGSASRKQQAIDQTIPAAMQRARERDEAREREQADQKELTA